MKKIYIFFIIRILTVIAIQTWFVPDETWQVTEVAHNWIFGYGYLCWEWKEKIRSIIYPGIFSIIYYALYKLKLDYIFFMVQIPRLFSAVLFAIGDCYMYKVSIKLYGKLSSDWVAVCLCTPWFLSYCAPRSLTSCAEMVLFSISLYYYPWNQKKESLNTRYVVWGGVGCIIRPTLALFLAPYCFWHWLLSDTKSRLLLRFFLSTLLILMVSVGIDSLYYGSVTVVPLNFVKFNLISGLSAHYGTHPWHWYFTQGLPVTCGIHLIPLMSGLMKRFNKYKMIFLPSVWGIFIHSILGHKEFRFLLPIIPLLLIIAGDSIFTYLKNCTKEMRRFRKFVILCILFVPNIIALLYMGFVHQRGPIDVMTSLRKLIEDRPDASLLFLTPCHSTPLYSYLHINIPARFLTCEPNLFNEMNYRDEAEVFFENPMNWLTKEFTGKTGSSNSLPTHIIMFDKLVKDIEVFLSRNNYILCKQVFNAHFYEGNRSMYLNIYCQPG